MVDDSNSPLTKADLAQFRVEFGTELRTEFRADMTGLEERLTEKMREMETRLLSAFYGFAATNQKRLGEVERDSGGVKDRLAILESRVTEVEKRLNMPPAA